jgi:hypothetical protein
MPRIENWSYRLAWAVARKVTMMNKAGNNEPTFNLFGSDSPSLGTLTFSVDVGFDTSPLGARSFIDPIDVDKHLP